MTIVPFFSEIFMSFISSSFFTALAENSCSILNGSGDSEYPCLILFLKMKAWFFSSISSREILLRTFKIKGK